MTKDSSERSGGVEKPAPVTEADIGKMFSVPWSPNPHRLEFVRPKHCSLHGEFIGMEAGYLKRRNSEVRPWGGSISVVMADDPRIRPLPAALHKGNTNVQG